jgi:hypothetical protein
MSPTPLLIIVGVVALLVLIVIAAVFLRKGPSLPSHVKAKIRTQWQSVQSLPDPHRRILEADTVVAKLLEGLGFQGSMADKLKRGGKYVPDLNAVWAAHKLRNRIAHEPGVQLSEYDVKRAMSAFGRVVEKYCA